MTTENCGTYCKYVEDDGQCCGQCITKPKLETLTDEQIQRGKSINLEILGDEEK